MIENVLSKVMPSHTRLAIGMANIDELFPGLALGDFALMYGSPSVLHLSLLLAMKAQLPFQLGGLETYVVFIDGGNTFKLYYVSGIAQLHKLDPAQVLERIFISRAFTAYQMASIILEKLDDVVTKYRSKVVIVSDVLGLYLDKDVPIEEAKEVFVHLVDYMSKFAEQKSVIVLATCMPYYYSRRAAFFHAVLRGKANVVTSINKAQFGRQFVLEKHPTLCLGRADFHPEGFTLDEFTEG